MGLDTLTKSLEPRKRETEAENEDGLVESDEESDGGEEPKSKKSKTSDSDVDTHCSEPPPQNNPPPIRAW